MISNGKYDGSRPDYTKGAGKPPLPEGSSEIQSSVHIAPDSQGGRSTWAVALGALIALVVLLTSPTSRLLAALLTDAMGALRGILTWRRRIRPVDWTLPERRKVLRNPADFRRLDRAAVALFGVVAAPAGPAGTVPAPGVPWATAVRHGVEGVRALVRKLGPGNVFLLGEAASPADEALALAWLAAAGFYERTGLPPGPGHTLFLDPDALAAQASLPPSAGAARACRPGPGLARPQCHTGRGGGRPCGRPGRRATGAARIRARKRRGAVCAAGAAAWRAGSDGGRAGGGGQVGEVGARVGLTYYIDCRRCPPR